MSFSGFGIRVEEEIDTPGFLYIEISLSFKHVTEGGLPPLTVAARAMQRETRLFCDDASIVVIMPNLQVVVKSTRSVTLVCRSASSLLTLV